MQRESDRKIQSGLRSIDNARRRNVAVCRLGVAGDAVRSRVGDDDGTALQDDSGRTPQLRETALNRSGRALVSVSAGFFTAYFALSPVTGLVCHRRQRNRFR